MSKQQDQVNDIEKTSWEKTIEIANMEDENYKKACIEGRIEGVELDSNGKISIIASIEDEEYKKACVEGKISGVVLEKFEKSLIIEHISEEYKKACIEGRIAGVELVGLGKIFVMMSIEDEEYIKDCVEGRIAGVVLDSGEKRNLIESMGDKEYKKACVEGRISGVKLSSFDMGFLIKAIEEDYAKACVEGKIIGVKLDSLAKSIVIENIGDEDYKKACVEGKIEGIELDNNGKKKIIESIGKEYARDCIEGKVAGVEIVGINKIWLIESIGKEYAKACVEGRIAEVQLKSEDKRILIEGIENEEYTKACIEGLIEGAELDSKDKRILLEIMEEEYVKLCIEELELDSCDKRILIDVLGDEKYAKACIEERIEGVELESFDKIWLIEKSGEEYAKSCIEGKINLTNDEILLLVANRNDEEYINNYINNPNSPIDDNTRNQLRTSLIIRKVEEISIETNLDFNIPKEMTIGIEIENEGKFSNNVNKHFFLKGWSAKEDSSLLNGVEIVSPILHPTQKDAQDIYKVTEMLTRVGQNVSERCGGHIHIGADYLKSKEAYKNLMEIWGNTEEILYTISNEKGTSPRSGMSQYASPITPKVQVAINSGEIELTDEISLDEFISELKKVQGDRYSGLNLLNIKDSKNTIEFRLANGTINPDLWMDNINLFGGIVAVSQELTETQDKRKQELFEKLIEDISNDEKLPVLLELVGIEPERYEERYKENIELMKDSKPAFSGIEGPTKFTAKKIKEMTKDVSASSQYEAIQAIINEQEREQRETVQGIEL